VKSKVRNVELGSDELFASIVYSRSCLLLLSGLKRTESLGDSRSPLYVENPPPSTGWSVVILPLHVNVVSCMHDHETTITRKICCRIIAEMTGLTQRKISICHWWLSRHALCVRDVNTVYRYICKNVAKRSSNRNFTLRYRTIFSSW